MKRRISRHKFALWLVVAFALASCSQEELAEQGTALPDGMYPLTFTAVQTAPQNVPQPGVPQTRVSENADGMSSRWDGGEIIKVAVSGNGNDMETFCTLGADGNIAAYAPQLYWQNTQPATINAWYSNITGQSTVTDKTVSLADQSNGLAYLLKADPVTANYNKTEPIALTFSHQLAKIRVKLEKGSYEGDLSNATVKVKGCTSCTVTDGEVSGSSNGYITMCKNGDYYEANLVPGNIKDFEISTNDKTTIVSLSNAKTVEAGSTYTLTITVNKKSIEITPSDEDQTINFEDGDVVNITGDGTGKKGKFIFNISEGETATVNLNNVKLNSGVTEPNETPGYAFKVDGGGTVVFKLNGTTTVEGFRAAIDGDYDTSANIHIQGPGTLKVRSNNVYGGIVTNKGKEIRIENATIDMTDCKYSSGSYPAAAIGSGGASTCGNITIVNCDIKIGIVLDWISNGRWYGAAIGAGSGSSGGTCGNIDITLKEGQSKEDFLNKISITNKNSEANPNNLTDDKKVGKGLHGLKSGTVTWRNSDGSIAN